MASPKFPRKEDLLWYLMTVGGLIIVGPSLFFFFFLSLLLCTSTTWKRHPSYICPHSAFPPTIAVPGNEGDYPRMSTGPSFAFRVGRGAGMVGCLMDDSGDTFSLSDVVF